MVQEGHGCLKSNAQPSFFIFMVLATAVLLLTKARDFEVKEFSLTEEKLFLSGAN